MSIPAADLDWIATLSGGKVIRCERAASGASRGTWLIDVERADGVAALVLRRDTGDGPLSGTPLTLEREARVYRALADSGVAIPRLVGVSPAGDALLVERASGRDDFAALSDSGEQQAVAESFLRALARLHCVDTRSAHFDDFARPRDVAEHALLELDLWQGILAARVRRPVPLLYFAFDWLRRHPPADVQRTVLCHGDAGPGNFLFERGQVTAILDWEFAHLGDPMDDLAWLGVRAHLLGFPPLAPLLELYQRESGLSVESRSIRFYQAFVLLRMAVSCLAALDNRPSSGQMEASTYLNLLPVLQHWLVVVLADLAGVDTPAFAAAVGMSPNDWEAVEVVDVVVDEMSRFVMPALAEPAQRRRAMGILSLLLHLQQRQRSGGVVYDAEVNDLYDLLGSPEPSRADGLAHLQELLRAGARSGKLPVDDARLLRHFARQTARTVAALWPVVSALAQLPPPAPESVP